MPTTTPRPPFAWLKPHQTVVVTSLITILGAFFRFWRLDTLPPGLTDSQAQAGLQALSLLEHVTQPALSPANNFAPLWIWLQAASIYALGHTELALRLWPAFLGTLAILTTWLWVRSWFGDRMAWLAAFLVAASPWAITLSRNGLEAAGYPLLVTTSLWLATRAWRRRSIASSLLLAGILLLDLLAGPLGWLLVLTLALTGLVQLARTRQLIRPSRASFIGLTGLAVGLIGFVYLILTSWSNLRQLPTTAGLSHSASLIATNLVKTLLMFNVYGDENYRHNLSGYPLLNVFVGLMLIAGLLVALSRLHQRVYRLLFVFALVSLIPAIITTAPAPNAARSIMLLPISLTLAALGISYLLELWYATFPINSAARSVGQVAIIVLLILTGFQGYTQYFRAWAGLSQVHAAYNEGPVQIAHHLKTDKFNGQRFIVATPPEQAVIAYLDHNQITYQALTASAIAGLPIITGPRQFIITAIDHAEAVKVLKVKLPGGVLRPHYSSFNQTEIYYTYELAK